MANKNLYITALGKDLWATYEEGKSQLEFLKIVLGNGLTYGDYEPAQIETVTAVEKPQLDLTELEVAKDAKSSDVVNIKARLKTEATIKQGFKESELGIIARLKKEDGTYYPNADGILYAYRNVKDEGTYIPAKEEGETWELVYNIVTLIANCEVVYPSVVIESEFTGKEVTVDEIAYVAVNYTRDHKKVDWIDYADFSEELYSNKSVLGKFQDKIILRNLINDTGKYGFNYLEDYVAGATEDEYNLYYKRGAFSSFSEIIPISEVEGDYRYQLKVAQEHGEDFKNYFTKNRIIVNSEITLVQTREPSGSKVYPAKVLAVDFQDNTFSLYLSIIEKVETFKRRAKTVLNVGVDASKFSIYASTVNLIDKAGILPFDRATYDLKLKDSGDDWTNIVPQWGKEETIDHVFGGDTDVHLEGEIYQDDDTFILQSYQRSDFSNLWLFDNNLNTETNSGDYLYFLGNVTYAAGKQDYKCSLGNNGLIVSGTDPLYNHIKSLDFNNTDRIAPKILKNQPFTWQAQLKSEFEKPISGTLYNEYAYISKTYLPPTKPNIYAWWNFNNLSAREEGGASLHSVEGAPTILITPVKEDDKTEGNYLEGKSATSFLGEKFSRAITGMWELSACPFPTGEFTFEFIKSSAVGVGTNIYNAFYVEYLMFWDAGITEQKLIPLIRFGNVEANSITYTEAYNPSMELSELEKYKEKKIPEEFKMEATNEIMGGNLINKNQGQLFFLVKKNDNGVYIKAHAYAREDGGNWYELTTTKSEAPTYTIPKGWIYKGRKYYFHIQQNYLYMDEIRVTNKWLERENALPYTEPWDFYETVNDVWAWWNFDEEDETEALTSKHSADGASDVVLKSISQTEVLGESFLTTKTVDFGKCLIGEVECSVESIFPIGDFTFEYLTKNDTGAFLNDTPNYRDHLVYFEYLEFKDLNSKVIQIPIIKISDSCNYMGGIEYEWDRYTTHQMGFQLLQDFDLSNLPKKGEKLAQNLKLIYKTIYGTRHNSGYRQKVFDFQGQRLVKLTKNATGLYTRTAEYERYWDRNIDIKYGDWGNNSGISDQGETTITVPSGSTYVGHFSKMCQKNGSYCWLDEIRVMKGHIDLKDALSYVKPWQFTPRQKVGTFEYKAPLFKVGFDKGNLKLTIPLEIVGTGDDRTLVVEKRNIPINPLIAEYNTWQLVYDGWHFVLYVNDIAQQAMESVETEIYPIPEQGSAHNYSTRMPLVLLGEELDNLNNPKSATNKFGGASLIEFIGVLSEETIYKQRLINVPLSPSIGAIVKADTINQGLKISRQGDTSWQQSFKLGADIQGENAIVYLLSRESDGTVYDQKLYKIDGDNKNEINFIDAECNYPETEISGDKINAIAKLDQCYTSGSTLKIGLNIADYAGKAVKDGSLANNKYLLPIFAVRATRTAGVEQEAIFSKFHFIENRKITDWTYSGIKVINFNEPSTLYYILFTYEMEEVENFELKIVAANQIGGQKEFPYNKPIDNQVNWDTLKFTLTIKFKNEKGWFKVKEITVITNNLSTLKDSALNLKSFISNSQSVKEIQSFLSYQHGETYYPYDIDLFQAFVKCHNLKLIRESFDADGVIKEFPLSHIGANVIDIWTDRLDVYKKIANQFNFYVYTTNYEGALDTKYTFGKDYEVAYDPDTKKMKLIFKEASIPVAQKALHINYFTTTISSDWIELPTGKSLRNPNNNDYRLIGFRGRLPQAVRRYPDNLFIDLKYEFLINRWRSFAEYIENINEAGLKVEYSKNGSASKIYYQVPVTYRLDPTSIVVKMGETELNFFYNRAMGLIIFEPTGESKGCWIRYNYRLKDPIPAILYTGAIVV